MTRRGEMPQWWLADSFVAEHLAPQLGPNGPGFAHFGKVVDDDYLALVNAEIDSQVQWRDNHTVHRNKRGALIHQNYDAHVLKLAIGSQEKVIRLPLVRSLVHSVENLVRYTMATDFPTLVDWRADEMALHRYDPNAVGIDPHRDQTRFWGIIALMTLKGEGQFLVQGYEPSITSQPGHLVLMRGAGLYPSKDEIRPMHSVATHDTDGRTSLVIRADRQYNEQFDGFVYDNWP